MSGETTAYLQDKNNPTGYSQILEERKDGNLDTSYVNGASVLGQSNSMGIKWMISDGHGSTRLLLQPDGMISQTYDFDAYGGALGFDPLTPQTLVLVHRLRIRLACGG